MHIASEGRKHTFIDFDNVLNVLKEKNCCILL